MFLAFLKGLLIGFIVSLPVGPVGFVCLQYALHRGFTLALIAGLGAAIADTLFSFIAGFGITLVIDFVEEYYQVIRILGGLFLCYLGGYICFSHPHDIHTGTPKPGWLRVFISTFALTLSNPLTIFVFLILIGNLLANDRPLSLENTIALSSGVFAGAMGWWFLVALTTSALVKTIGMDPVLRLRRIGGLVLVLFGLFSVSTSC